MKRILISAAIISFAAIGALAEDARLGELRVISTGENLIDFKPEVHEYHITVPRKTEIVISGAPSHTDAVVTITAGDKTFHNQSEVSLTAKEQTVQVAVENGTDSEVYSISCTLENALTEDFRELSIYQIMPAAFMRGECDTPGFTDFWGPAGHRTDGNLQGITASLDYIKGMGFNALWLTPIFDTTGGRGGEKLQATGYTVTDFFNIDPRFGGNDGFRELIAEAHKRDIYIILDITCGSHGLNAKPSPSGKTIDAQDAVPNIRGDVNWYGNVAYPGSLDFFREVFRYWMEEYEVDGWRLDVAYQLVQDGHNYWKEIREEVEAVSAERRAAGHAWGCLGYMVGEDWTSPANVVCTRDDGLRSCFDFDGRGTLIDVGGNISNITRLYSNPTTRGYERGVTPNLFITNHDMTRIADIFPDVHRLYFQYAMLAAYSGPVTFYYNDELAAHNGNGNPDNMGRVSGRTAPETADEAWLYERTSKLFNLRAQHPAMWRGQYDITYSGNVCSVTKTDPLTGDCIVLILPTSGGPWTFDTPVTDAITGTTYSGSVYIEPFTPVIYVNKATKW